MPKLLPVTSNFEHMVHWSIRNFDLCPPWDDIVVTSPEFDLPLMDPVPLRLFLESRGPGNGMLLGLCSDGDASLEDLGISFRLDACFFVNDDDELVNSDVPPERPPKTPSVCCVVMDDLDHDVELDDETLLLHVTVKTSVKQGRFWSRMFDMHLVALSNDLVSMVAYPMSSCCDCSMASINDESSMVHSCILKARVPHLFKAGSRTWDEEQKKWATGLSEEATRTAKFYLYGSLAVPIPENQRRELMKFARLHKLKDLRRMLRPDPFEFSAGTILVLDDIGFNLLTADIAWVNTGSRKLAFPLKNISTRNLEVTLTTTPDRTMDFTFEFPDFEPVVPIYMKGSVKLINHSDGVVRNYSICHTFRTRAWTSPPPHFVSQELVDELRLKMVVCKIQVTEGLFEPKGVEPRVEISERDRDPLVINNLRVLGDQLLALYTKQVDCDLELHLGGEVFKVHKALAMARSPRIKEMVLKQKAAGESKEPMVIRLANCQPKALKKAIRYMYSGRIELDKEIDIPHLNDVMDLANHLKMHLLEEEYAEVA